MVRRCFDAMKWIVTIFALPIIAVGAIIAIPIVAFLELFDRFAYHMTEEKEKHPSVNEFCPVCGKSSEFFISREKFVLAVENMIVPIKVKVKTCEECGCISVNKDHFSLACFEAMPKFEKVENIPFTMIGLDGVRETFCTAFVRDCREAFQEQHKFVDLEKADVFSRDLS